MREYGSIKTGFWSHPAIWVLSNEAKLLAVYLLTGPHSNMLGCFRLPLGYVAEDLHWCLETVAKGFIELENSGFLIRDEGLSWVFLPHFLKENAIDNPNQGKSIQKLFAQVPKETLFFREILHMLLENPKYLPPVFYAHIETLLKPFRNQEQEQDQEQEQEQDQKQEQKKISLSGRVDEDGALQEENDFEHMPLSSKAKQKAEQSKQLKTQAREVLQFLNEKTGRAYRPINTNLKLIMARLQTGASVMDCRQVIAKKTREWKGNPKMAEYLRPATLFNATKFEQYLGELLRPEEEEEEEDDEAP